MEELGVSGMRLAYGGDSKRERKRRGRKVKQWGGMKNEVKLKITDTR